MRCCSDPNKDVKDPACTTTVESAGSLATDPVCGMTVDPAKAATVEHEGTKFYFCCQGCATKFQADPAKYLQPKPAAPLIQLVVKKENTPRCITRGRRVVPNAGWHWSQRRSRRLDYERNTPAQCIPR
jgi:YHS domain-containing protein